MHLHRHQKSLATFSRCCSRLSLASLVSWILFLKARFTVALCRSISCLVCSRTPSITPRRVAEAFCSLSAFRMFSFEKDAHWSGVTELKPMQKVLVTLSNYTLQDFNTHIFCQLPVLYPYNCSIKLLKSVCLNTCSLLGSAIFTNDGFHSTVITHSSWEY